MISRKKIILILSVGFSLFLTWYLFVKESDYCITFTAKTATGTIFQGINVWSTAQKKSKNENYTFLEKRNY